MKKIAAYKIEEGQKEEFIREVKKDFAFFDPNSLLKENGIFTLKGSCGLACLGLVVGSRDAYLIIYNQQEEVLKKERSKLLHIAEEF